MPARHRPKTQEPLVSDRHVYSYENDLPEPVLTEIKCLCIKWYGASEMDPEILRIAKLAFDAGRSNGPSHKLVAYGWRSLRDGSYGDKIAPINYAMHERNMEKLRNDPWVKNGAAEIVPLYADCSTATTEKP
jgi:hypothetical protein